MEYDSSQQGPVRALLYLLSHYLIITLANCCTGCAEMQYCFKFKPFSPIFVDFKKI